VFNLVVQKYIGYLFAVFFLVLGRESWALDTTIHGDVFLYNDQKYFDNQSVSSYQNISDTYTIGGLEFAAQQDDLRFFIRPEFRSLLSPGVNLSPTDPAYVTVKSPPRALNLGSLLVLNSWEELYTDVEHLYLSWNSSNFEISVGRRPVSLGVLKYLPVWNKFTAPPLIYAGPGFIYSSDNATLRFQAGDWAFTLLEIEGATGADAARIGQVALYSSFIEIHGLAGVWWEQAVGGLAFAKDLGGMTIRGETLWVGLRNNDTDSQFQGGLGFEYAFSEKFSFISEWLYLNSGIDDQVLVFPSASRFRQLQGDEYNYTILNYNITSLWKMGLGPLINLTDGSTLVIGELKYSASDNLDFAAQTKIPTGKDRTELSPNSIPYPNGLYAGLPYLFSISAKWYF